MRNILSKIIQQILVLLIFLPLFVLTGCQAFPSADPNSSPVNLINPKPSPTTETPKPTSTTEYLPVPIFIDPIVPDELAKHVVIPEGYQRSTDSSASIHFTLVDDTDLMERTYAVVVPFFTVTDSINSAALRQVWSGKKQDVKIQITKNDAAIFTRVWGDPNPQSVDITSEIPAAIFPGEDLVVSILPFDQLNPHWKVLSVDGMSPLQKDFSTSDYPLTVYFGFTGDTLSQTILQEKNQVSYTNRDASQMTTLVMTGTTALARATANKMDTKGITYPAENVQEILSNADITHISNEVSFTPDCPPGNPFQGSMIFCSRPEYLDLLKYIGTDIVELTGNHNLDWGYKPYLLSLDLYGEAGIQVYGGGIDALEARDPALLTHNGNRFAFLGCNYPGPASAQATANSPGAAACDYDYLTNQIQQLRAEGIIPIVTVQHAEYYHMLLSENQVREFEHLSNAGAVIVQGSQSHFAQPKAFSSQGFIDYGPGNLFFDQMDRPVKGTRNEFITRYTFYRGELLSIELTTWILEDYAQPREMTPDERAAFLQLIFDASQAAMEEYP